MKELAEFGLFALVDAVFDDEYKRGHPFAHKFDLQHWRHVGIPFLAAIPNKLLAAIIEGNLAKRWATGDPELVALYGAYKGGDIETRRA